MSNYCSRTHVRTFAPALFWITVVTSAAGAQDIQTSFDMFVPHAPAPALIGDTTHLVYELHITNFAAHDLALDRIEVMDAATSVTIARFEDSALIRLLGRPGVTGQTKNLRTVMPGMRAVVYFWIPLPAGGAPDALTHRVTFDAAARGSQAAEPGSRAAAPGSRVAGVVTGGPTAVIRRATAPPLGPPLRGGPWVAVYDPAMERGHRRVIFAYDGQARIPARFAIDWMKIDEEGRLASGDATRAVNHYGYGAEVLAVADAVVADVRDTMSDRTTTARVSNGLANASGNYITLDLGDGRFASYEHLMARSIRVAVGERVKRGQVIARVGFTGDGSSPHLHMHVSNGPTPLAGEGVPWTLESFTLLGGYPTIEAFGRGGRWAPPAAGVTSRPTSLPRANAVVRFESK